ncbi:MAG: helix-hairpin-helix domain-containing protein [Candidatus Helarchaeota archaeon]
MDKENRDKIIEILVKIKEIDRKTALKLYMSGIHSLADLISCDYNVISKKIGESPARIQKWIDDAKELREMGSEASEPETKKTEFDPIKYMSEYLNISIKEATKLRNAGVFGLKDLSNENPKLLAEDSGMPFEKIKSWIYKAREKYKGKGKNVRKPKKYKNKKKSKQFKPKKKVKVNGR